MLRTGFKRQVCTTVGSTIALVASLLIGLAKKVLNVPDRVKSFVSPDEFTERVLPRLSSGDDSLWNEFSRAARRSHPANPERTVRKFRELPIRPHGRIDLVAHDDVLLVPVLIDNVHPPRVARNNGLGIDADAKYRTMLDRICKT